MKRNLLIILMISACPIVALAGSRTSANYTILTDALDASGGSAGSAAYQHLGSAGLISGLSSAAGGLVFKHGYVAQLDFEALTVLGAVSRKTHGAMGAYEISLPLTGLPGIECRAGGAGGNHQIVITFTTPVSVSGVSVVSRDGQAAGTSNVSNSSVTVDLTAVANAQTLGITLLQVSNGSNTADIIIPMGVLLGDTNGSGAVSASDIGLTKSQSGQPASITNFRTDVNVSGAISASDIGLVKSQSGTSLP